MRHPSNKEVPNPTGAIDPSNPPQEKTEEDWRLQIVNGFTDGNANVLPESYRPILERSTRGFTSGEAGVYCSAVKAVHDRRVASTAYYFYDTEGGAK